MAERRSGLGKGLEALIPQAERKNLAMIAVDEIDPIASFHCSVTRELPDGSLFQPQEVYSRQRALYSYTMGNAIAAFEEDIKGSITPGKLADITVLSQDLLTVADDEVMDTEIVMTILGGEIRFRDGEIVR